MNKSKKCSICGIYKLLRKFGNSKRNKGGLKTSCMPCSNFKTKVWKKSPAGKQWHERAKFKKYNLSKKQYDELSLAQNGVCAICSLARFRGNERALHIDHCHQTGKIRGLLCYVCNTTLGKFERFKSEILNYLEEV